jgi:hypothetical protein
MVLAIYILVLWDVKLKFSSSRETWKLEYNGLLWVGLDRWSITKYRSNDRPKQFVEMNHFIAEADEKDR